MTQLKLSEPVRIILSMMTSVLSVLWLASFFFHWFRPPEKGAWYGFATEMTIVYGSILFGLLVGWSLWKFTERFK